MGETLEEYPSSPGVGERKGELLGQEIREKESE